MPGAKVRFAEVSADEARQILIEQEQLIAEIKSFVGLDLAGAISVRSSGSEFTTLDSEGRIIASPGVYAASSATRQVSATVGGHRFDFEIEVASP